MPGYGKDKRNTSLNLMGRRLGVFYQQKPADIDKPVDLPEEDPKLKDKIHSIIDPELVGVENQAALLGMNGGLMQQERMIFDKRRSLDRALLYSYQGANIIHANAEEDEKPVRALINPNKLKQDYDDKVLSVHKEDGYKPGDVFEWINTKTHWLIYLQDLTELAYFRGDIRKCSFEITWEDEDGIHSTFAAVRGPVETKINYIQKHNISCPSYKTN